MKNCFNEIELKRLLDEEVDIKRIVAKLNEQADLFAMSYAGWAMYDPQGQAYLATRMSAYDHLNKYKDRPFLDFQNPQKQ